jgi:hypothetical protein
MVVMVAMGMQGRGFHIELCKPLYSICKILNAFRRSFVMFNAGRYPSISIFAILIDAAMP